MEELPAASLGAEVRRQLRASWKLEAEQGQVLDHILAFMQVPGTDGEIL